MHVGEVRSWCIFSVIKSFSLDMAHAKGRSWAPTLYVRRSIGKRNQLLTTVRKRTYNNSR